MKNRIRLNESQLHRVIKESVKRVLMEIEETTDKYEIVAAGASGAIVWSGNSEPGPDDIKKAWNIVLNDGELWDTHHLELWRNGKYVEKL